MSNQKNETGQAPPNGVVITEEIRREIERIERGDFTPEERAAHQAQEAEFSRILRAAAEEHAEILRRSRACRCFNEDGVRQTGVHCPMHTVYR